MMNITVPSVAVLMLTLGLVGAGCGSPPPAATPPTDGATTTGAADKDSDGDGIPDSADKCLDKKEDGLGPQPKDGCPNPKP